MSVVVVRASPVAFTLSFLSCSMLTLILSHRTNSLPHPSSPPQQTSTSSHSNMPKLSVAPSTNAATPPSSTRVAQSPRAPAPRPS
ncbi:hypothetical protein EXIGLDRAFT_718578 [Exidia glandulosa HHB12029]|uniref:Uncharacterized protein n=1 Tax=Exidia glandulosa HHB12029 TaxID=1314781 RepID=A0A165HQ18_EXIGL|nr:hypothetical protein EXIGLDRAFT_718578 [Exidia glandulosa HHB12029]